MQKPTEILFKVAIVGDFKSGKTTLCKKLREQCGNTMNSASIVFYDIPSKYSHILSPVIYPNVDLVIICYNRKRFFQDKEISINYYVIDLIRYIRSQHLHQNIILVQTSSNENTISCEETDQTNKSYVITNLEKNDFDLIQEKCNIIFDGKTRQYMEIDSVNNMNIDILKSKICQIIREKIRENRRPYSEKIINKILLSVSNSEEHDNLMLAFDNQDLEELTEYELTVKSAVKNDSLIFLPWCCQNCDYMTQLGNLLSNVSDSDFAEKFCKFSNDFDIFIKQKIITTIKLSITSREIIRINSTEYKMDDDIFLQIIRSLSHTYDIVDCYSNLVFFNDGVYYFCVGLEKNNANIYNSSTNICLIMLNDISDPCKRYIYSAFLRYILRTVMCNIKFSVRRRIFSSVIDCHTYYSSFYNHSAYSLDYSVFYNNRLYSSDYCKKNNYLLPIGNNLLTDQTTDQTDQTNKVCNVDYLDLFVNDYW